MVRTRGGSHLRPRVRFITPSGRSRPQFQLRTRPQYQLQSPRQSLRSLKGSRGTRHGWDPGPLHQYHSGDLGGPGPPSEPVLQSRGSPHPLGHSRRLLHQLQRRHLRHSFPQPRGSGGPYSSGILSRVMSGYTRGIFIESHTMMSRR